MLIEDIRVDLNLRTGVDIIFDLGIQIIEYVTDSLDNLVNDGLGKPITTMIKPATTGFDPAEGDYYSIIEGVATLVKVRKVTDSLDTDITDNLGNPITTI